MFRHLTKTVNGVKRRVRVSGLRARATAACKARCCGGFPCVVRPLIGGCRPVALSSSGPFGNFAGCHIHPNATMSITTAKMREPGASASGKLVLVEMLDPVVLTPREQAPPQTPRWSLSPDKVRWRIVPTFGPEIVALACMEFAVDASGRYPLAGLIRADFGIDSGSPGVTFPTNSALTTFDRLTLVSISAGSVTIDPCSSSTSAVDRAAGSERGQGVFYGSGQGQSLSWRSTYNVAINGMHTGDCGSDPDPPDDLSSPPPTAIDIIRGAGP